MLAHFKRPLTCRMGFPFGAWRRSTLPQGRGASHFFLQTLPLTAVLAGFISGDLRPAWAQGAGSGSSNGTGNAPEAIISPQFQAGQPTQGMESAIPTGTAPGSATGAPAPRPAPDYATHRRNLNARKMSGMEELRISARGMLGRAVEMEGEVKGSFLRSNRFAILFATRDGQLLTLEIPEYLAGSPYLKTGSEPQVLLKVDGIMGQDVALSLVNVTASTVRSPQEYDPGAPVVLTPMTAVPNPGGTIVYDDTPIVVPPRPQPSLVPSRSGAISPAPADVNQRFVYRSLAKRYNPRLQDDMADYIAVSLLNAASSSNLDPRFLAAVVAVESNFNPYSLSSSGAMGLGQIMPFNLRGLGITNAWDPMQNLRGAARMLRSNLDRFEGKPNSTLLAVAAYHAGGNAVARAGHQVPNKVATQKYVWKVYYAYKSLAPELFQ